MSNFDYHAFTEDLGTAAQYVPLTGKMDEIVLELTKLGYGAANVADGWRKINLPEVSLVVQLELGEPVNQDLLSCVVLNDKIHEGHYFPLVSTDYDRYDFPTTHRTAKEVSADIDNFYRAALKFVKAKS